MTVSRNYAELALALVYAATATISVADGAIAHAACAAAAALTYLGLFLTTAWPRARRRTKDGSDVD